MPEDIQPPQTTTLPSQGLSLATPLPPRHPSGSLIMPDNTAPSRSATGGMSSPAPPRDIQPVTTPPAPVGLPPLVQPPPPQQPNSLPSEDPAKADLDLPPDEKQLQAMRKTYRIPVEKLARRRQSRGHVMLVVCLLLLVIGTGIGALLLTDTLSI